MCAACVEYSKEKLTLSEFKTALREASAEDAAHLAQVERLIQQYGDKPDELKRIVKPKSPDMKDY